MELKTRPVKFQDGKEYQVAGIPIRKAMAFLDSANSAESGTSMFELTLKYLEEGLLIKHTAAEVDALLDSLTLADYFENKAKLGDDICRALTGKGLPEEHKVG